MSTDLTVRGRGAAWIVPLVLDADGKINSLGTAIEIDALADAKPLYAKDAAASKQEVISVVTQTGVTIEANKKSKTIDAKSGDVKAAAGGGGNGDKISMTVLHTGKTKRRQFTALRGEIVLVVTPSPESLDGATEEDFQGLICTLTSDVSLDIKPEAFITITLEFTGGQSYAATTAGAAALAMELNAITPRGETVAVEPPAITSGNVTEMLKGILVDF